MAIGTILFKEELKLPPKMFWFVMSPSPWHGYTRTLPSMEGIRSGFLSAGILPALSWPL